MSYEFQASWSAVDVFTAAGQYAAAISARHLNLWIYGDTSRSDVSGVTFPHGRNGNDIDAQRAQRLFAFAADQRLEQPGPSVRAHH